MNPTPPELPSRARVVVIGGGIIGASVAYHLGHLAPSGWGEVVLLERDQLTSGTTWHAAGLMVTFGSLSSTSTAMRRYTRDLYARLEAETGQATGFAPVGFVELATGPDRLEEFRRVAASNRWRGVDVHEISPREVGELFPLARTDDLSAGFYVPGDGRVNPVDATMALAKGARQQGVRIVSGVSVTEVLTRDGAVCGVRTEQGDIECDVVVNCAGMWARQLGARNGVSIPLQAAEHYYLITEEMPGLGRDWPVIEDPDHYGYYREEVGGLMIGLFEPVCAPWKVDGVPGDSSFTSLAPDWDRMGPYVERAMQRVPLSAEIGIRTFFCGPESFTPDLAPLVGEAPEIRNYFVGAGLNSIGILTGGGLGRLLATWIIDGRPDDDVTGIDIARLHPYQATAEYRRTRTVESLGMVYQCHYPHRSMTTARGSKVGPLHTRLVEQGAFFRDVSGWEGADWFAGPGVTPDPGPLTWGRPAWWSNWEAEHRAVREGVGLIDMSFMATFRVEGPDAADVLERLSANEVTAEPGRITYTQWLDEPGTLLADLTVTHLDGSGFPEAGPTADTPAFLVVATDTAHRQVLTRLRRACRNRSAHVSDVTSAVAQLNLQGPRSRELLALATTADVSDAAFPFRAAREIDLGFARPLCARITYVGELGYELFVPTEQALHVHDHLVSVAATHEIPLRHVGLKALGSLRLEKGYRDYGHDLDNCDDPLETGLGFAIAWDKPGGFIGHEALLGRRAAGTPRRRLVSVQCLDPDVLLFHGEVLWRDGERVGDVRAASYGHAVGGAVGLAMLSPPADGPFGGAPITADWLSTGSWEIEVAGSRHAVLVSLRPLYDPTNARIRS
jgi:glycine cleavage system aminomethyltransferase T/glycine/D-amino acid oxidase-like deaminating enzyme